MCSLKKTTMSMIFFFLFILSIPKDVNSAEDQQKVVKNLDVAKYMGRWYEIASFPSIFQPKSYANTRATYSLNPNGTITVLNESWNNGKSVSIQGIAFKADPKSDEAKLKVRFFVPPFLPIIPVTGDYWILFVDVNYQHALVGHPSRNYLWILNREPKLDEKIYNELVEMAKEQKYDVSRLHLTPQTQM
ncbi:temperature-induced lipocalin-1-like [Andrographis paniculata]|uniref:temperature-induced lipocalin-1-like n=1 Tax=Andrographis paniculata TaxID=175694 RepID=UPI0021E78277|nr:temperature-induced lipocalin-1-like [Andrographis paniculata]